jgi:hypothetical protein
MPISNDHHDLFHSSGTLDKINLFQTLLDSQDLTAMEALALINTIHLELEQQQGHDPAVYTRYVQMMEAFQRKMPDLHAEVVRKWSDLQFILKSREPKKENTPDDFNTGSAGSKKYPGGFKSSEQNKSAGTSNHVPDKPTANKYIKLEQQEQAEGEEKQEGETAEEEIEEEENKEAETEAGTEHEKPEEEKDGIEEDAEKDEGKESEKDEADVEEKESAGEESEAKEEETEKEESEAEVEEKEGEEKVEEEEIEANEEAGKEEIENREQEENTGNEEGQTESAAEADHIAGEAAEAAAEQEMPEDEPPMESAG